MAVHYAFCTYRHKKDKPFMKIEGEWDGILTVKDRSGVSYSALNYGMHNNML